jgi:excisionase family DNA binding protein
MAFQRVASGRNQRKRFKSNHPRFWTRWQKTHRFRCNLAAPVVRERPPDPGPHERLITVSAVAARLGVSTASVYKLCQRGELSGLRIGGALRFQPSAIDEYLGRPRLW